VAVDWSKQGEHIAKHGVTAVQASEALTDPDAVVFDPDYNSRNGEGVRTIGFSPSAASVLTVITYVMGRHCARCECLEVEQPRPPLLPPRRP
jgi:uncharacterized DUF497 family protein